MAGEIDSSQAPGYDRDAVANAMLGIGPKDAEGNPVPVELFTKTPTPTTDVTPEVIPEPEVTTEEIPVVTEEQPGATPEVAPEVISEIPTMEIPELDEYDVIGVLQEAGLTVQSFQQIQEALALQQKYTESQKELSGLSDDEKRRIAVAREFGDATLYDRVTSINADVIPDKEILRQIYFLRNTDKSVDYLTKQFDRDFKREYEDDDDEDFLKSKLANDVRLARETMKHFQEELKSKTIGTPAAEQPVDDSEERRQAWMGSANQILENADKITYTVDGAQISIVMDPTSKAIVQQAMYDPIGFINELITDEKGKVDHEALYELIMRNIYFEKLLSEAKNTGRANFQETQLKQLKNVEQSKTSLKIDTPKPTPQDAFAAHIQQFK